MMRQLGQVELSTTPTTVGRHFEPRSFWDWCFRINARSRLKIEQMPLTFSLNDLLGPPAIDPPLQRIQFIHRGLMCRLQLFVRGGCRVEYSTEFFCSPKGCQQQLLTLNKISGEVVVVIHYDHCSSGSFRLGKTISGIILDGQTIPSLTTAPAAQVEAA